MLAELGRRGDAILTRGSDAFHEAIHVTALHLRRIGGAMSVALSRVTGEARDLVWDYRDVASDLRRPGGEGVTRSHGALPGQQPDDTPNGPPVLRVVNSEE